MKAAYCIPFITLAMEYFQRVFLSQEITVIRYNLKVPMTYVFRLLKLLFKMRMFFTNVQRDQVRKNPQMLTGSPVLSLQVQ